MSLPKAPVMAMLLFLAVCMLTVNTHAAPRGCCASYTPGKIPFGAIKGFSIQTKKENCPIDAIIFHTKKGKKACTNPAEPWVMYHVSRLGNMAHTVHGQNSKTE